MGRTNLGNIKSGKILLENVPFYQKVKEISTTHVLEYLYLFQ
jgi:hypothetical protein